MGHTFVLKHREAIIMVTILFIVTGFNLWQHRGDPPLGYKEFTGYGFSFVYPRECTLNGAVVFFIMPSYWMGDLQGESQGDASNIIGIVWGRNQAVGLKVFSDQIIEEASKLHEIADLEEGKQVELGGKQVFLRGFNLRQNNIVVPGLMAGWSDPEGRLFVLYNLKLGRGREWLMDQMATMMKSLKTQPYK